MVKNKKMVLGKYGKNQKINKAIFLYLSLIFLFIIGYLYQTFSVYADADQYGRVGKLADINGYNMHLYTSSGKSDLSLVFTSNIGASVPYTEMYPIFSKLPDEFSKAVYDKPGYGWSDLTKEARDIDTIVSEIHEVLHNAEYPFPIIFVAHSMGSLEAIRYAQLYPEEVAGIVLIDGAAPDFCSKFNNIMIVESFLINGIRNVGALRLLSDTEMVQKTLNPNPSLPHELRLLNTGIGLEKIWNRNMIEEKLKLSNNAKVILEHGTLGNIPLRIITSKANPYGSWQASQTNMLSLSTNSLQTYINGSVNVIELSDIDTIIRVIKELAIELQPEEE